MANAMKKVFKYKHYYVIISTEDDMDFDNYLVIDERTEKKVDLNIFDLDDFLDLAFEVDLSSLPKS